MCHVVPYGEEHAHFWPHQLLACGPQRVGQGLRSPPHPRKKGMWFMHLQEHAIHFGIRIDSTAAK